MFRRTAAMLACCPTDDQAEVLVGGSIERREILAVAVRDEEQAKREIIRLSLVQDAVALRWVVAPQLFTVKWSTLVRLGRYPDETSLD